MTTKTIDLLPLTAAEAPSAARPVLERTAEMYGFTPNLLGVLAHSPAALHAYASVNESLGRHSHLSRTEQQAAILAISVENGCTYCVAAHSVAAQQAGLDDEAIDALRDGRSLDDPRLEALTAFARRVVEKRGWVRGDALDAFVAGGFEPAAALDVITLVALKTLSNYTNHIAETPLDEVFASRRWNG